jgi:putative oxidoreductase
MASGLLLLRLVLGVTLAGHGVQKLFGWFGGHGLKATSAGFAGMGFRAPTAMVLMAGLSEAAGGAGVALGFLTPFAALALVSTMIVAVETAHWAKGFWAYAGGYEYNLLISAAAIAVAATGPGRFSLDRAFGWDDNLSGWKWGLGVVVASAVLAFLTLALGRSKPVAAAA